MVTLCLPLLTDKQMGTLLKHFHEQQKVTALVCHGPIALLSKKRGQVTCSIYKRLKQLIIDQATPLPCPAA
jgi:putative intracellular protease/amidase